jgi:hypothetical protein
MDRTSLASQLSPISQPSNQILSSSNPLPTIDSSMIAKSLNYNLPIKLNNDNYIYYKALVLPAIIALELEDFINGVRLCPNKYTGSLNSSVSDVEPVINSDFLAWRRLDPFLLS